MLTEGNYIEKINAMSKEDWRPLLSLIPEIKAAEKFGELIADKKTKDGTIIFPFCIDAPVVQKFHQLVYALPIVISFDWGAWKEGRKIIDGEVFDLDSIDIPTKCKIITTIVRMDRFTSCALASEFNSGLILRILESIKRQLN